MRLSDLVRSEVTGFATTITVLIGDLKSLTDKVESDMNNAPVMNDILTGILAESISLMMDDIMPSIIGVEKSNTVAEKMLRAKLESMESKDTSKIIVN